MMTVFVTGHTATNDCPIGLDYISENLMYVHGTTVLQKRHSGPFYVKFYGYSGLKITHASQRFSKRHPLKLKAR